MMNYDLYDFSECRFIEDEMKFYTYFDFVQNKEAIKRLFERLSKDGKLFYMWYVYANIHMETHFKDAIWDYLNGYDEQGIELTRKARSYKAKL